MDHQKKYNNKKTPELKTVSSSLAAEDEEERHINERRKDVGGKKQTADIVMTAWVDLSVTFMVMA